VSSIRRTLIAVFASAAAFASLASAAQAASSIPLYASGNAAFAVLGHSCGGIQQKVYETGFAPDGYPTGNVLLSTSCGGSGRGGGYHSTTYTATATVVWTWFGETRSITPSSGPLEATAAEDGHGDRLYNVGTSAYLETGTPPLQAPVAPTGTTAFVGLYEPSENVEYLRLTVGWNEAPETEQLVKDSTVTATPVGSTAPVLSTTTSSNYFREAGIGPVEPNTTYRITVTNTDAEGTSEASAPIELRTPNSDGEAEKEHKGVYCETDKGTVKLTPGITETPTVQTVTVKGTLGECNGGPEGASYTMKFTTSGPVTCALLAGTEEITPTSGALKIKWLPNEEGSSTGTMTFPVGEGTLSGLAGSATGGPVAAAESFSTANVAESFTAYSTCGVPLGKKAIVKPVKAGSFTTGFFEFQ